MPPAYPGIFAAAGLFRICASAMGMMSVWSQATCDCLFVASSADLSPTILLGHCNRSFYIPCSHAPPRCGPLSLHVHSSWGNTVRLKPKQAVIIRMSTETLEALESFSNHPEMHFDFGSNPVSPPSIHSHSTLDRSFRAFTSGRHFILCAHNRRVPRTRYICAHPQLQNLTFHSSYMPM